MQTKVKNTENYLDYTKCGEVLKPPSGDFHRPYILKCFNCKEIYLLLEAFMFHFEENCKYFTEEFPTNNEAISEKTEEIPSKAEHVEIKDNDVEDIKEEEYISVPIEDPLTSVKSENDEPPSTSQDFKPLDTKICVKLNIVSENKLNVKEDICETESVENLDISDDDYHQSSDDDDLTSLEDDTFEIKTRSQRKTDPDSKLKCSNFIKKFFENKEHVISFIESYKNQASLWNRNYPYLKTKAQRQHCLQKMADDLNEQHNFSITWDEVRDVIVYLCRKYRKDIRQSKENGKNYTPSWFFENLNFLKTFMDKNQITKLDSNMTDLQPKQIIEILEIYKSLPHLWNTELIEFYCKNKVEVAKQEMLEAIEKKMDLKLTETILDKYLRSINIWFARKRTNKPNSGSSASDSTLESCYEYMLFLKDHVGRFSCSECEKSFKNPLYLKIHKNNAHGFEPFPCSECKKPFKSVTAYTSHAKRHMEDLNFECKDCNKKFLYAQELKIHMRRHNELKPFCCEMCGTSFRHIQTFKTHQRRHLKNYLHHCELCGKGFYTKDSYKNHMNSHSNTRNQVCSVCGKTFVTKHSLRQHIVIHDDIKRFPCKLCGKTFKQKTGVNQHMRTHAIATEERPHL